MPKGKFEGKKFEDHFGKYKGKRNAGKKNRFANKQLNSFFLLNIVKIDIW